MHINTCEYLDRIGAGNDVVAVFSRERHDGAPGSAGS